MTGVRAMRLALRRVPFDPRPGDDASEAELVPVSAALTMELSFDHNDILRDGLRKAELYAEHA